MPSRGGTDPHLAAVLRDLRQRAERSQESLAHDAGISVSAYRKLEGGRQTNPRWMTLRSITEVLGVSVHDLAREVDRRRGSAH
jgi:transcriptional regulator with XRE-family HTH domain